MRVHIFPPFLLVLGGWDLYALPHTGQVDTATGHHRGAVLQAEGGQEKTAHTHTNNSGQQTHTITQQKTHTHTNKHKKGKSDVM